MGTLVTIQVLADGPDVAAAVSRAFGWFREIESRCTRFDPESELMRLCRETGIEKVEAGPKGAERGSI